jgi:Flp pilus assembly pilin Flp
MTEHRFRQLRQLARDTRGLSTVEYVVILAVIVVVAVSVWRGFGDKVTSYIRNSKNAIHKEMPNKVKQ